MARTYTPPQSFETTSRPPIALKAVDSSQIAAIGFDADTQTLAVQFIAKPKPGTTEIPAAPIYHYSGVSQETFDALDSAESLGQFLDQRREGTPSGLRDRRRQFERAQPRPRRPLVAPRRPVEHIDVIQDHLFGSWLSMPRSIGRAP